MKKNYYEELFGNNQEAKAAAFDNIAKKYFFGNFGTMTKADFETLLFAEYFSAMVSSDNREMSEYTDRALGLQLGLTPSRIASLKERAEIKYMQDYDWKVEFRKVVENAREEDGKIKINISEKMLFIKMQEEIESQGSFVDMHLNPKIFQVSPGDFVHLMLLSSDDKNRADIIGKLKEYVSKNDALSVTEEDIDTIGRLSDSIKSNGVKNTVVSMFRSIKLEDASSMLKSLSLNVFASGI